MSLAQLQEIKSRLKSMYVGYNFNIVKVAGTNDYLFSVYRDSSNIGSITLAGDIPMNEVWDRLTTWMRGILSPGR